MSVFDPHVFENPPNRFRPLQIVHGLDHFLSEPGAALIPQEADPAGQWAERLTSSAQTGVLVGLDGVDAHLQRLRDLGVGGIVTNVGFTGYLVSPREWALLRHGLRRAMDLGLRVWLYDEKGYPSGTAGGIVTRASPEYAATGLACYPVRIRGPQTLVLPLPSSCRAAVSAVALRDPERATHADAIDLSALVDGWGVLRWAVPDGEWTVLLFAERVMYEGTHAQGNVSEFKHYVNLLEPDAVRAFLRVTHEAYRRELQDDLWRSVEAIFTDEPSFMTFYVPALPERYQGRVPVADQPLFEDRPPAVPWVGGLPDAFRNEKGYDLKPHLYALFHSDSEDACYVRQDFYDVVTRRYCDAFYAQVRAWCHEHGIASSGHLLLEENILDHVIFHGSLFAAVRKMDLPGIDMLNCSPREMLHGGSFMGASFMAVKQVASVAHLTGRERVHSESSDWEQRNVGKFASLAERRGQANLQYVLGVNQITSYFGWTEFTDQEQRAYHDYVGRLGVLLTGGRHVCDVAVLYPIRTLWAHYKPPLDPITSWTDRVAASEWEERIATAYPALVKLLLCHQIDCDIVDEEALVTGDIAATGALSVADESYRVIVLPPVDALALETVRALAAFCRAGGTLLSVGPLPSLAQSPEDTAALRAEIAALFGPDGRAHRVALADLADAVRLSSPPDLWLDCSEPDVLYTHRVLEGKHVYFVINNRPDAVTLHLSLRQCGPYVLYRPLTGQRHGVDVPGSLEVGGYEGVFVVTNLDL